MAKKEDKKTNDDSVRKGGIVSVDISAEMRTSYLDYAMSVITTRALPDVRDGLKPVHRRILFAMNDIGLSASSRFRKSATVIGEVLGKYHPHGDSSVYDAMVKMAQTFSYRYPLVLGQGNFGCFTKDTKVKLTDGRSLSFADLIKEDSLGKKNYTYTINKNGKVEVALILKPRLTKKSEEIIKVILDNNAEIKCTLDHKFLLKDQTYVEARNLKKGESLMPLYTRLSNEEDTKIPQMEGYEMVLNPNHKEWVFTHHIADNHNVSNGVYPFSDGQVRHHIDFNKLNNSPDNIKRMHWKAHWDLHSNMTASRHKNDPTYVKNLAEGRVRFWNNKENREKYSKRISERNKKNWKNAEYREKICTSLRESNLAYIEAHPEKREEFSQRLTKTLKRLWQDPAYRVKMHQRIIKGNKNHTTNKTGKVKFDKICTLVLKNGEVLSQSTYEKTRLELYPNKAATNWGTGFSKYYASDRQRVVAEINGNHKVKKIVFLNQQEDVYDLTIFGTHNFALAAGVFVHNSVDGDPPAAMRYTEAKMSKISGELVRDLDRETVEWRPNYDGTRKEPVVMPSAVPGLLLNGTLGIAVGMATNIPPHNLKEVLDATVHLIDNPDATTEDLLKFVKGPDFPTGGIAFNQSDINHAYATGRGGVVCRGEADIEESKSGSFHIIITSLPFRVNKADLIMKIADQVRDKKLEGIKGLRDESTRDVRVVIDLKAGAHPQKVLNYLYKHTDLETTFHYNMLALSKGIPKTFSLKAILDEFIIHRQVVVRRRTEFDLKKAQGKEHILLGLKKALDHIDKIIKLIKASKDGTTAHKNLMKEFRFSDKQSTAILEMRLQKLAGLERKKIEDDLKAVQEFIKELQILLGSENKILTVIKKEIAEIKEKYGDERRTKIIKGGVKNMSAEDLIPDEESILVFTAGGYLKRTNPEEYKRQRRGGVGVVDLNTKEEDFVSMFVSTSTHSDLLFFTDKGKVYQIKMYDVPLGKRATKGKSIMNFLSLAGDEKITSILPVPKEAKNLDLSLVMVTKLGVAKRVAAESFHDVRKSGIIAIKLGKGDELLDARLMGKGDSVILATKSGQSIRFKDSDIREMGRSAGGVRAIKLTASDELIGADIVKKDDKKAEFLVISENGYGKKTPIKEYKIQKRGGSGIKTFKVTPKTGKLMAAKVVDPEDEEVVAISKKSQVIRVAILEIPSLGRQTQGVRVMKLRSGDSLASLICF